MLTFNFHPFPVIFTQRLILRSPAHTDAAAIYQMRTDPEVMKYLGRPFPKSVEEINEWVKMILQLHAGNESILWAISLKETVEFIGTICYWRLDAANHRAETGFMLKTEHQGKGYIQEAIKEVIDYGFNQMHLHSIEANITPDNLASKKALERSGFVQEAYFKEYYYANGNFIDSVIYSLLAPK